MLLAKMTQRVGVAVLGGFPRKLPLLYPGTVHLQGSTSTGGYEAT